MPQKHPRFETLAIHAGQPADPATGAVMPPIQLSSTFKQAAVAQPLGYEYARTGNPTRAALESCLAALEAGAHGLAFASGMAAIDAVLRTLDPGDHVLAADDLYGGSVRLFNQVYTRYGLTFDYADASDTDGFLSKIQPHTKLVWLETPTNPYLNLVDLEAIAAGSGEALVAVDNTFATPYLQQPLALGCDLTVHSTTKYLGGHSDVVGGAIVLNDDGLAERLAFLQNAAGAVPSPFDCFLVLRGIKTLPVRMDRHSANAAAVALFLEDHSAVSQIFYPFQGDNPQGELARHQMRSGGGMVSFLHAGGEPAARAAVEATHIFTLAESLGGVESLIEVPAAMTHLSIADTPQAVDPALIRLSVGLEAADDLIEDLDQALKS